MRTVVDLPSEEIRRRPDREREREEGEMREEMLK